MLREHVAEQRAKTGAVHTYFSRLAEALLAAWRAKDTRTRRQSGRPCEVEVRLVLDSSGHLRLASILFPSCDPLMDEELLTDLRTASYPAPPPEVIARREDVRCVFRFAFHPPPKLPSLRFDVVDLLDRKAIADFEPRRVSLVRVE